MSSVYRMLEPDMNFSGRMNTVVAQVYRDITVVDTYDFRLMILQEDVVNSLKLEIGDE